MKLRMSASVVGLFVIGAVLLALIALLSFGGVNFFSRPQRFVVYFNESIQGLDLGSPVKLMGVRVGRVVGLRVRYNAAQNKSVVAVVCEINRDVITDGQDRTIDVSERSKLQALVNHGLRAQLGVLGLATGLLFVDLNFYNPHTYPGETRVADGRYVVVPAVPSAISEYQASLSEILSDLKRVDFAGLSNRLNTLLTTANDKLKSVDVARLSEHWTKAADALAGAASDPEIKRAFAAMTAAGDHLQTLIAKLDGQVKPTGDQLAQTLEEARRALATFNSAAATAQRFIATQSDLGVQADRTLEQLRQAAASVQRLADYLERNPQAILTGRQPPR